LNQETQPTPISAVPESQTENSPKVSSLIVLPYTTNLNTLVEYVLPFKHNRGKPPNRYSPDTEERRSKFLVANYVSTQHLSNPIQNFTKTLSSCHTPDKIDTTTLSSVTDGLIPSVTAMKSVGENNTDGLTDGTRPSV